MPDKVQHHSTFEKIETILLERSDFLESQLHLAGLQMVLFEFLKDMVRSRLEFFFGNSFEVDEDGNLRGKDFDTEHKDMFEGNGRKQFNRQLNALREMEAINEEDIELIHFFRSQRNQVAHRLIKILVDDKVPPIDQLHVRALLSLIYKLDNWWFREVEVTIQPQAYAQFSRESLDKGHSMAVQLLIQFVNRITDKKKCETETASEP